ncbi:UNVERIFIED_CONTAM: 8-oxo-dGTP diphosphatase [Brevibacillus sp. OAP136]
MATESTTPKKYRSPDGLPTDICLFTITTEPRRDTKNKALPDLTLKVLLIQRDPKSDRFPGYWAFPGGFSTEHETIDACAERELREETHLSPEAVHIEQLRTYYAPGRDPGGWIPTVVYYALVNESRLSGFKADDDAADARLFSVEEAMGMQLAFDHNLILQDALQRVQEKMLQTNIAKEFLPREFTLSELLKVIETVVPSFQADRSNFGKKLVSTQARKGIIEIATDALGLEKYSNSTSQTKAKLYRFTDYVPPLTIY